MFVFYAMFSSQKMKAYAFLSLVVPCPFVCMSFFPPTSVCTGFFFLLQSLRAYFGQNWHNALLRRESLNFLEIKSYVFFLSGKIIKKFWKCIVFFLNSKKKNTLLKRLKRLCRHLHVKWCQPNTFGHIWREGQILKTGIYGKKYLLSFFQSTIDQKAVTRVKACLDSFVWYNN